MKERFLPLLITFAAFLQFVSCGDNPFESDPVDTVERGEVVEIISEEEITLDKLISTFEALGNELGVEINLINGVKLYSVIYRTIDWNGNPTDASGLFVVPLSEEAHPLISLHHGTQSKRENVGSQDPLRSLDALLSGALGYAALSPDQLGLGVSPLVHPYHVQEVNANTVIDFIRAFRKFAGENSIELNDQLFLTGYSQGGYTTMAVHKKMQEELSSEFQVTASAPMAGAHDLVGTAQAVVENDEYDRPAFLAFITYAYSQVYGWNDLSLFFQHPYQNLIPTLFNGTLTTEEIDGALPSKLSELYTQSFIDEIKLGTEQFVFPKLNENSLLDWAPQAPVLIVHGNADTFVPYQNAITAKAYWEANGSPSVDLVTVDGGTHYTSIFPAIFYTFNFFESFREQPVYFAIN